MPVKSSIVFLPVSDIKATTMFYRDVLHLNVAQEQGNTSVIFDTGYGYWGFCEYADGRKLLSGPQGVCLSLNLSSEEEVWEVYERLKDRTEIHKAPSRHPLYPVYSFFLKDPDGYLVEFQKISDSDI